MGLLILLFATVWFSISILVLKDMREVPPWDETWIDLPVIVKIVILIFSPFTYPIFNRSILWDRKKVEKIDEKLSGS